LEHFFDLLLSGFVDVACGCRVGETYGASEIAAVGHVDYAEACVAFVVWAEAAVLWAAVDGFGARVVYTFPILPEVFCTEVLVVVAPVQRGVFAVGWTGFFDVDFVVFFIYSSIEDRKAFRTDAFGLLNSRRGIHHC
jgi:hypothetical protein